MTKDPNTRTTAQLSAYLPRHLVRQLAVKQFPLPGQAVKVWGVALFSDVSGFTPLSEGLNRMGKEGAERLTAILNIHFDAMVSTVHEYGGSVIKYGGDAMTILFPRGEKAKKDQLCSQALTCALAMQEKLLAYAEISVPELGEVFVLSMKVGLSCGDFHQMAVGNEQGQEYVAAGRVLDQMAEAEHHAVSGQVVASGDVIKRVGEVDCEAAGDDFFRVDGYSGIELGQPETYEFTEVDPDLLAPYVPAALVEHLRDTGGLSMSGEHRRASTIFILFSGIDYDGDPLAFAKLQEYYVAAASEARRYGGRVNRVITGDKGSLLHLIFGAPKALENSSEAALNAALAILDLELSFALGQKIGVNTGEVFGGDVGSSTRREYTIMGDAVNIAARLMQAAPVDEIWCSASTHSRARQGFRYQRLDLLKVKGKSQPLEVHQVLGTSQTEVVSDSTSTPMVGREPEWTTCESALQAAQKGLGGWLHIGGEAGVGKSRLLSQVHTTWTRHGQETFGARCFAHAKDTALGVWSDLLARVLRLEPGFSRDQARKVMTEKAQNLEGVSAEDVELTGPALGWWPGLVAVTEDAESRRMRLYSTVEAMVSGDQATLLTFEDSHNMDGASLDLLKFLARNSQENHLLFLTVGRVSEQPFSQADPCLVLQPLKAEVIPNLLSHLLPGGQVDPEVVDLLMERSKGFPQVLVEVLWHLVNAGGILLEEQSKRYYINPDFDQDVLPEGVGDLLLARLDQLPSRAREVVKMASVFGEEFEIKHLLGLLTFADTKDDLKKDLALLKEQGLVSGGGGRLHFPQAIVREVAYQSLLFEQRRELHGLLGTRLEDAFGEDAPGHAGELAFHYRAARLDEKAFRYTKLAANNAVLAHAHESARVHLDNAMELADNLGMEEKDRLPLLHQRSSVNLLLGRTEEAFADRLRCLKPEFENHGYRNISDCTYQLSKILEDQNQWHISEKLAHGAQKFATRAGWKRGAAQAGVQKAFIYWKTGRQIECVDYCKNLEDFVSDEDLLARINQVYAMALRDMGNNELAQKRFIKALDLAGHAGQDELIGTVCINFGTLMLKTGEGEEAENLWAKAESIFEKNGNLRRKMQAQINLGNYFLQAGNLEKAGKYFEDVAYWGGRLDQSDLIGHARVNLGIISFYQKDLPGALKNYQKAYDLFAKTGNREALVAKANIAETLLAMEAKEASHTLEELFHEALDMQVAEIASWAGAELGKWRDSQGDPNGAVRAWQEALTSLEAMGAGGAAAPIAELLKNQKA